MVGAPAIPPTPSLAGSSASLAQPPRAAYAGLMALATALGVGAAAAAAGLGGGGRQTAQLAAMIVAVGSVPGFAPAVVGRPPFWGMFVLAASMARLLAIVAMTVLLTQMRDLGDAHDALWGGVLAGAGVILMIESAAAVVILKRMQPPVRAASLSSAPERV